MDRIDQIKARTEKATEGPWEEYANWLVHAANGELIVGGSPDAEFIAHAREDVPWLLARVGALEDALRWALYHLPPTGYFTFASDNDASERACRVLESPEVPLQETEET